MNNLANTAPDVNSGGVWLNLDRHMHSATAPATENTRVAPNGGRNGALAISPRSESLTPALTPALHSFEAYRLHGIGSNAISTTPITDSDFQEFRRGQDRMPRKERGADRVVAFLTIDPKLRDEILHRDISLFPSEGLLPKDLSALLKKLGIGEERLVRVLNLSPTGRYTSEQNKFHSFCIPEHQVTYHDLAAIKPKSENESARVFKTNLVSVIYNKDLTIIITDGQSPTVKQFADNLKDGSFEFFKRADRLPCVTTIIKDIVEANSISCQRVLRIFDQLKNRKFKTHDTVVVVALKMALAELQNYWITEEDPVSSMEKLLNGIKKDGTSLGSLLNKPDRFNELLDDVHITTQKVHQLNRSVILREDARRAGVESRALNQSASWAALGSACVPNALVSQLPITDWKLQLVAHGIASVFSAILLFRMKKLGWFDFVTENFGDLFGFKRTIGRLFGKKQPPAENLD